MRRSSKLFALTVHPSISNSTQTINQLARCSSVTETTKWYNLKKLWRMKVKMTQSLKIDQRPYWVSNQYNQNRRRNAVRISPLKSSQLNYLIGDRIRSRYRWLQNRVMSTKQFISRVLRDRISLYELLASSCSTQKPSKRKTGLWFPFSRKKNRKLRKLLTISSG